MIATYPVQTTSTPINDQVTTTTCYYLRKLLAKHTHELQSFIAAGAGLVADAKSNINHVLESLYLDDLEITLMARELEVLTQLHQSLSTQIGFGISISGQLAEVERRIFWILGLKRS
ncbi:MAG: hypothetical protein HC851_05320 [Acaryochloris sp. RU_4_1]|nr:hypothetical protein [Acaryochloris sp. RU_4_1]NJN38760.1 hypothetical protein [Acaryochloridaceae cyanobacterium CSU_3_4]NJR57163.1 hypothetical protein [Acaryochloris sp. CRU_2_0]